MFKLKLVTVASDEACDKDLRAPLSIQNIQAATIKVLKKQRVGDENGTL